MTAPATLTIGYGLENSEPEPTRLFYTASAVAGLCEALELPADGNFAAKVTDRNPRVTEAYVWAGLLYRDESSYDDGFDYAKSLRAFRRSMPTYSQSSAVLAVVDAVKLYVFGTLETPAAEEGGSDDAEGPPKEAPRAATRGRSKGSAQSH